MKKVGTLLFIVLNVLFSYSVIYSVYIYVCVCVCVCVCLCVNMCNISVNTRIWDTWNKFKELIGMLVRKQGLSLKQQGKIYVCYIRPVFLHCCETLELAVANEEMLHRVECHMIYTYYISIHHN